MSVKLVAAVLVIAGGVGAAASVVQHNPQALSSLGGQMLAFRGPFAAANEPDYVPGKYYRICRNEYARHIRDMTQAEQREACKCFDREFQTWSPDMQEAAKIAMHTAIAFSQVPNSFDLRPARPGAVSNHDAQVRASQHRDTLGAMKRNYADGLNEKTLEKAKANPVTTAVATARVTALARSCKIIGNSPFALPGMNSVYKSVGGRN